MQQNNSIAPISSSSNQAFIQQSNQLPRLLKASQQQASISPQKGHHSHLALNVEPNSYHPPQQVVSLGSQKAKKNGQQIKQQQQSQQQKFPIKKQNSKSNPPNYDSEKLRKYKYYLALKGVKDKKYEEISNYNFQLAQKNEEIWNITTNQVQRNRKEMDQMKSQRQKYLTYPKQKRNQEHPGVNDKSDQWLLEELQAETQMHSQLQSDQILKEIGVILKQDQEQNSGEIKLMVDPSKLKYLFAE